MNPKILTLVASTLVFLAGCTAQEKKVVHELENLPGVTCEINDQGIRDCHPDNPNTVMQEY